MMGLAGAVGYIYIYSILSSVEVIIVNHFLMASFSLKSHQTQEIDVKG